MKNKLTRIAGEYFLGTDTLKKLEEERELWYKNVDEEDKKEASFLSELQENMYKAWAIYAPNIGAGLVLYIAAATNNPNCLRTLIISEGMRLGTKALNGLASKIGEKQIKELLMNKAKIKKLEEERSKRGGYSW